MLSIDMFKFFDKSGVSLYLTMVVLTIMSASFFALTTILVSQSKVVTNLGNSVVAFSAADTGIEEALYKIRYQDYEQGAFSGSLANSAAYNVVVSINGSQTIVRSTGLYRQIQRAIEAKF